VPREAVPLLATATIFALLVSVRSTSIITLWNIVSALSALALAAATMRPSSVFELARTRVRDVLRQLGQLLRSTAMAANPAGVNFASLEGVSCTSSTSCRAIGYSRENGKVKRALAESWNGTTWSIQAAPNPGEGEVNLKSLSCTSSTACTAVGSYVSKWNAKTFAEEERKTLVESWNGTEWAIQASANPKLFNVFSGVSDKARAPIWSVSVNVHGSER